MGPCVHYHKNILTTDYDEVFFIVFLKNLYPLSWKYLFFFILFSEIPFLISIFNDYITPSYTLSSSIFCMFISIYIYIYIYIHIYIFYTCTYVCVHVCQSQVRKSTDNGVKWAECSLIIGTGCRVQVFSLILDSSVGLLASIQSAGDLVSGTPGSNPAFSRGTQLVSFRLEYRLPVPEHRN